MALFAGSILAEMDNSLDALHGSDNATWGTPKQSERKYGDSLDERLDGIAAKARKLIGKGKRAEVEASFAKWRTEPIRPQVVGQIPNMAAELQTMNDMFDRIVAGQAELDPALGTGNEAEEIRYYTVKRALERHHRWQAIMDEIARRTGL